MQEPSFDQLAEFVRDCAGLRTDKRIVEDTQFERDLGITGDDGADLLEAVERKFHVAFTEDSFCLGVNEYLFGAEGIVPSRDELISIFGLGPEPTVRSFTVGELYEAVLSELKKKGASPSS